MTPGSPAHPPPPRPRPKATLPPTPESWLPREHNLYRPRHSRKQRTALVCAVAFFLAPALAFVSGVRAQPFENRELHGFPSPADGWSFFTGLRAWATDHLPLREAGVDAAAAVSTGFFGDPPGVQSGARQGSAGMENPKQKQRTPRTPQELYPKVITGDDGWVYLGEDITSKCFPARDIDRVIKALNRLRRAVESSGRRFELVFPPDKSTAKPTHLPDEYLGKKCAQQRSREFWRRVPRATGAIDLRPALNHADERYNAPVYDSMDSHWTFVGGLTMTYALAERLAPGSTESWLIEQSGRRSWPADLPRLLGRSKDRRLHTFTLAPDGDADRARYAGSDFRVPLRMKQSPPAADGIVDKKVAVVADSFTQFASPYLAAVVRDLTIVHADTVAQARGQRLTELLANRDVVVFEFVERIVAGGGSALLRDSVLDNIERTLARHPR